MGVPDLTGKGKFGGRTPSQNMQLQIAAKQSVLCCRLANPNEELGGLAREIPTFAKLLWSLLLGDRSTQTALQYNTAVSQPCPPAVSPSPDKSTQTVDLPPTGSHADPPPRRCNQDPPVLHRSVYSGWKPPSAADQQDVQAAHETSLQVRTRNLS